MTALLLGAFEEHLETGNAQLAGGRQPGGKDTPWFSIGAITLSGRLRMKQERATKSMVSATICYSYQQTRDTNPFHYLFHCCIKTIQVTFPFRGRKGEAVDIISSVSDMNFID